MIASAGMLVRDGTPLWLYETLNALIEGQQSQAAGFGAIIRGESPDGSGNPLGLTLPNDPGAVLFVKQGPVLGTDRTQLFWDDENNYLGIGTNAPDALLTISQPSSATGLSEQFAIGALGTPPVTIVPSGTFASVCADESDSTYVDLAPALFGASIVWDFTPTVQPTDRVPGFELRFRIRRTVGTGLGTSSIQIQGTFSGTGASPTKTLTGFESYSTTDFTAVTFTFTEAEVGNAGGQLDLLSFVGNNSSAGGHGWQISRLSWCAIVPAAPQMTRWYAVGSLISQVDYLGRFGIGTGSDTLSRMLTVESNATSRVPVAVMGFSGQTANLQDWVSSADAVLSSVTANGYFSTRQLLLNGSTSGTLTLVPNASTVSHTLTWPQSQGAAGSQLLNNGSGVLTWAAPDLLGTSHGDTLAGTVVAGDIIIGNNTPKWSRLAKGSNGQVLALSSGLPAWVNVGSLTADFADNAFSIHDEGDATKLLVTSLGGATTGKTLTLISSHTDNRSVTFPNATTTLAGLAVVQTFTEKQTIQASGDEASLIVKGSGSAGAGTALFRVISSVDTDLFSFGDDGSGGASLAQILNTGGIGIRWSIAGMSNFIDFDITNLDSNSGTINLIVPSLTASNTFVMLSTTQDITNKSIASGAVSLTNQSADINIAAPTNITVLPNSADVYVVECILMCTTADATAGNLTLTIGWTDNVGATTQAVIAEGSTAFPLPLTATGRAFGRVILRKNSGSISYGVVNSGAYNNARYALYIRVLSHN